MDKKRKSKFLKNCAGCGQITDHNLRLLWRDWFHGTKEGN